MELRQIKKYFVLPRGVWWRRQPVYVRAVDGVSFFVRRGETLGLVGESGCGKTTLSRIVLRLVDKDSGEVYFCGRELYALSSSQMRDMRRKIQVIFQDPFDSLDPRFRVRDILGEALFRIKKWAKAELEERLAQLLADVRLPQDSLDRFPSQFSGGQRQRIAIARAIAMRPQMLVLDEAVSSLDADVQGQILDLLRELKERLRLSCLFISHNLKVVRRFSDRSAVMYLGKIVEIADTRKLFKSPADGIHPYTEALLAAGLERRAIIRGEPESPAQVPAGCRFHTRCPYRRDICSDCEPQLERKKNGHFIACHFR